MSNKQNYYLENPGINKVKRITIEFEHGAVILEKYGLWSQTFNIGYSDEWAFLEAMQEIFKHFLKEVSPESI